MIPCVYMAHIYVCTQQTFGRNHRKGWILMMAGTGPFRGFIYTHQFTATHTASIQSTLHCADEWLLSQKEKAKILPDSQCKFVHLLHNRWKLYLVCRTNCSCFYPEPYTKMQICQHKLVLSQAWRDSINLNPVYQLLKTHVTFIYTAMNRALKKKKRIKESNA